ncbi:MAG: glycosyltransferase [Dehalococcoidia bacterium]|nr:glycosyltransferase [Dehalococcoidia bacterium]
MVIDSLRIAVLSVHSSPLGKPGTRDTGGMSTYIREVAPELAKRGILVDIFTRAYDRKQGEVADLAPGVRLIHLRAGANKNVDKLLVYSYLPDLACGVENFRKREGVRYDLIFSHYWLSGVLGQTLQYWWRVPQILMFHTLGAVKNALGIGEDEPELRIEAEGELARSCQRVIAATRNEKDRLVQHYGAPEDRIRVIPCGVNLELFKPADKLVAKRQLGFSDEKVVLFVGRIEVLKGIDNLLRTMPHLRNGVKPRLVIVGGDGYSQRTIKRLKVLSTDLDIDGSVTFSGLVDYESMPLFYNAADVCVVPSYYESFGLVALESLACGTPVVATDVGDLRNIIRQGESGYVVQKNTPLELADKIGMVLSSPGMTSVKAVRASVTRFCWSNVAQALTEVFEEVLVA